MNITTHARAETTSHRWVIVSAKGQVLGRLAAAVAKMLMGKHRPTYTAHVDTGDFVIVTDAAQVVVTGRKAEQKVYRHHTGFVGHLVARPFKEVMESDPAEVVQLAVRRMLPKTKLGKKMFTKLKVYAGAEHPHAAQKPEPIKI